MAGLNNIMKRKHITKPIKELKPDLLFLQETHISICEKKNLRNIFKGQIFHFSTKVSTEGVMINIAAHLDFKVGIPDIDNECRFLLGEGQLKSDSILLVNEYAPNDQQLGFCQKLIKRLARYEDIDNWIIADDFHRAMDRNKGRTGLRLKLYSRR